MPSAMVMTNGKPIQMQPVKRFNIVNEVNKYIICIFVTFKVIELRNVV